MKLFKLLEKHRGKVKQPAGLWTEVNKLPQGEKGEGITSFSPVLSSSWLLLLMYYPSFILADGPGCPVVVPTQHCVKTTVSGLGSLTMKLRSYFTSPEFQFFLVSSM